MPLRDTLAVHVVDDMSTSRGMLLQSLDLLGIGRVEHSNDGEAALRSIRSRAPALVLSDLYMPHMDGLTLLEHLRRDTGTERLPFILVTARVDDSVHRRGAGLGLNAVLSKPYDLPALQSCIESVVGHL